MNLTEVLLIALAVALLVALIVVFVAVRRADAGAQLAALQRHGEEQNERIERELRTAVELSATQVRMETGARLSELQSGLIGQLSSVAGVQTQQLGEFGQQVAKILEIAESSARASREEVRTSLAEIRTTLEQKLAGLQADNAAKLEQMRATVEEKLQSTLEARLGASFQRVSEQLERVHKGLGEMQSLAVGVGDLKRVLTNVKSRGTFGEMQLGTLLEQVLLPEQYASNVATRPGSKERVEFAIRMPGRSDDDGQTVWLPIDAKFPVEDYERLLAAQEVADKGAVEAAARALEVRVRLEARTIRDKYVEPPFTTDFAVLFLPTEGLFAEVLRRPGLVDALNREARIVIAGPTTLFAMLNTLQMGFRTLAIERRSAEVWQVLSAVKTEFARFGNVLATAKKQLQTVANSIESAEKRTRQMQHKLKDVEALPAEQAQALLPGGVHDEPEP